VKLTAAFSGPRFPSFVKSKVVRDKYTNKGKGFGFVAYSDPEAEMAGSRSPIKRRKCAAHGQDISIGHV
jgi:hypothetical protein